MLSIDLAILYFFNQTLACPALDVGSELLTNVHYWFPIYVVCGLFLIYRYKWEGVRIVVTAILLIAAMDSLGHYILKPLMHRERPCALLANGSHIVSWIRLPTGMKWDESFPSNHALNNFGMATFFVVVFRARKSVRWLFLLAALIAVSRIYEGVHYPSDVMGGAVIGVVVGLLFGIGFKGLQARWRKTG